MAEIIINDINCSDYLTPPHGQSMGLVPRNYMQCPVGYLPCAKPFDLPLIPESEWQSRLDAQIAAKAQLSDIRNRGKNGSPMPSTDQNGYGYCWCHSGTSAILLARAAANEPYVDLSAYAVGCIIKNYRNQGGWGSEGVEFIASRGIPSSEFWPQRSTNRANDNPATWENAALHKNLEWMDLQPRNKAQLVTCLLLNIPVVSDFNWWGHSVCTMDLVSLNPFKTRIWNSWGDGWSENGAGILEGSRAIPDGALGVRVVSPSEK